MNRTLQLALLVVLLIVSVLNTFLSLVVGLLHSRQVVPPDYALGAGNFLTAGLFTVVTAGLMWALFKVLKRQGVRA